MVGLRPLAVLVILTLFAWPAAGSLVEGATGGAVAYQFDGESGHDAPDLCAEADPAFALPLAGRTDGMLVPPDDARDVFVLDVGPEDVGARIHLTLMEAPGAPNLDLGGFAPLCDGDLFAARNQPTPFPAPPAPAEGQVRVPVDASSAGPCGDDWFLLVNGLRGNGDDAPRTVHAAWSDGSEGTVDLTLAAEGAAIYRTSQGAAFTLTDAWANLPADWAGTFKVAHAPCAAADGGAVYGDPAELGDDLLSFTPVRAGPHVVQVSLGMAEVQPPPTAVPLSCHLCFQEVEQVAAKAGYTLAAVGGGDQDE